MADLRAIDGGKKEPCPWCGEPPHKVPLACPRIAYVVIDNDQQEVLEVHFWAEGDEPDSAA